MTNCFLQEGLQHTKSKNAFCFVFGLYLISANCDLQRYQIWQDTVQSDNTLVSWMNCRHMILFGTISAENEKERNPASHVCSSKVKKTYL